MVTIIEKPYEIAFSKNPVNYTLVTDVALNTPGLTIEARLSYRAFRSTLPYENIIIFPLTPDSSGRVSIDFKKVLDSLVSFELPTFDITPQKAWNQLGEFYISYREITTADPNPAWTEEAADKRHIVIKGGLPYQRWQGPNFFKNFDYAQKCFLTWQPSGRLCASWEKMWLTYFHLQPSKNSIRVQYTITYTDGTNNTSRYLDFSVPTIFKYALYRIPTGVEQLALQLAAPAKQIDYYDVQVLSTEFGNNVLLSPAYRYYVDYRIDYQQVQFNAFNSLGSLDSVRVLGEINKLADYERDAAEKYTGANYFANDNLVPMNFMQQVIEGESFKGNIGGMDDEQEQDMLRDLLLSKDVYQVKYSRWWPVLITTKQADFGPLISSRREMPIEWTYGFSNENYAPEWMPINELSDSCPLVTNVTAIYDGNANKTLISWAEVFEHNSFEILVKETLPDNSVVETTYFSNTNSLLLDAFYNPAIVQVKAICDSSSSAFTAPVDIPQQVPPMCAIPSNLEVLRNGANYTATWTGHVNAVTYDLEEVTIFADGSTQGQIFNTAQTQYTGTAQFVTKRVRVRARCGNDLSPYTNFVDVP